MGSYADLSELVNRMSGGNSGLPEFLNWHKEPRVAGAAAATTISGQPVSAWEWEGTPSHGAVPPTSVAYPDNTTAGSWQHTSPSGGRERLISAFGGTAATIGTWYLYDRLAHISGLSGTVTTPQNVLATSITRNTGGKGNFIAYENYTIVGTTATTITADYTNSSGVGSRTTQPVVFGATGRREPQRFVKMSLQAGDQGVQQVNTVTVLATTGTAGDFGIVIGQMIGSISIPSVGYADVRSFVEGGFKSIGSACLAWYFVPQNATLGSADLWHVSGER